MEGKLFPNEPTGHLLSPLFNYLNEGDDELCSGLKIRDIVPIVGINIPRRHQKTKHDEVSQNTISLKNTCSESNQSLGKWELQNRGPIHANSSNVNIIKTSDCSLHNSGNTLMTEELQEFREARGKINDTSANVSPMRIDLQVGSNASCLVASSERSGKGLWNLLRNKYKVALRLMKMRRKRFNVVRNCPVRLVRAMEIEKLTERSRLRRQAHEKTWHSEWLQEMEVYQKLLNAVEQYQRYQDEEKRRKSKVSRHLLEESRFCRKLEQS